MKPLFTKLFTKRYSSEKELFKFPVVLLGDDFCTPVALFWSLVDIDTISFHFITIHIHM